MHWAWLDEDVKDRLVESYIPGQCVVRSLKSKKWYAAMAEARMKLKELDKYGD